MGLLAYRRIEEAGPVPADEPEAESGVYSWVREEGLADLSRNHY